MSNTKYLDLNGLTYYTEKLNQKKADIDSPALTGTPTAPTPATTTSNNEIATTKFVSNVAGQYVAKKGDTMTGPLKFQTTTLPVLDLKFNNPKNGDYSIATNTSVFVGDATSNAGARLYFARNVPALNTALLTSTSLGYNPRDEKIYQKTTDYGIKFDVNVASNSIERPSAIRQCGSFFVGLNGAYIGYSGSTDVALSPDKVYRILDSNCVKDDAYIQALEQRIAALENTISQLETRLAALENN